MNIQIKSNLLFQKHKKLLGKEDFYWKDLPPQQKNTYVLISYRLNKIISFILDFMQIDFKSIKIKIDLITEQYKLKTKMTILYDNNILFSQTITEKTDYNMFVVTKKNLSY